MPTETSEHHDEVLTIEVSADEDGARLDRMLQGAGVHESRSRVKAMIKEGCVTRIGADGETEVITAPNERARTGQRYRVCAPAPSDPVPKGEAIALDVRFEDDHVIVVNKPAGLVVHPAAGHWTGTLVNALIAHCGASLSGIGGVRRPGIVHRLDRETSGLMVVAKSDAAHAGLSTQFAAHGRDGRMRRVYEALVWSGLARTSGTIDAPLARAHHNRLKMSIVKPKHGRGEGTAGAKHAVTHWRREEVFVDRDGQPGVASRVTCQLETGRTHQIRVHMASIGHPVLGDPLYGAGHKASASRLTDEAAAALAALGRQALHAGLLAFLHPLTGEEMLFEAELPSDHDALLRALRASPAGQRRPGTS